MEHQTFDWINTMATQSTVYDSVEVADYFIEKARERGGLDPLQVMKLTYIAHGFVLGLLGKPLLEDDVEAWKYGPVIRRLYSQLPRGSRKVSETFTPEQPAIDEATKTILDAVFELYGQRSGLSLSSLTHSKGTPWKKTWDTYGQNAVIPQSLIEEHYQQILEQHRAATRAGKQYHAAAL